MSTCPDKSEDAQTRALRWWRAATGRDNDGPGAEVVTLRPDVADPETDRAVESPPGGVVRRWIDRQAPLLPPRERLAAQGRYYAHSLPPAVSRAAARAPVALAREVVPVCRGCVTCLGGWWRWVSNAPLATDITAMDDPNKRATKRTVELSPSRKWRGGITAVAVLVVAVVVWWVSTAWIIVAAGLLLGGLDALGHYVARPGEPERPAPRQIRFHEGMPLRTVTQGILNALAAEGIRVEVATLMTWDPRRSEYRLGLAYTVDTTESTSTKAIEAKHLRAVERWCGFSDHSVRMLGTDTADVRELVIRHGDPLASVPTPSWVPTGSVSINDAVDLGVSVTDQPFALNLASHIAIVGRQGGGKTKWALWTIIDRLSACRDVVLYQCGVQTEPDMALWGDVFQRRASTPDDAEKLLREVKDEVDRRLKVLAELATDDDPTNDRNEWDTSMGPALFVVLDELSLLTVIAALLALIEYLIREGRKVMVYLILATQKTGNSDFGSTVMQSQVNVKIALACTSADTDKLFGSEKRRAGWEPHLLQSGVHGDPRDAGKCYVEAGSHTTPDVYRFYRPLAVGDIKRRRATRLAGGLPTLSGSTTIDAVLVDPALAAVDMALVAHRADRLPSEAVVAHANGNGGAWTQETLAEALRPLGVHTRRSRSEIAGGRPLMCYHRSDVDEAMRQL